MSFSAPGPRAIGFLRIANLVVGLSAIGFACLGLLTAGFAALLSSEGGGLSAEDWREAAASLGLPTLMFAALGVTGLAAARALRSDARQARRAGLVAAAVQVVLCAAFLPLGLLGLAGIWILWRAPLASSLGEQSG